jgi:membrane protein required for colicin V production
MFTLFDVIVCIIILLTSVISFMRGGTKDVLSLLAWVGAGATTVYFYPYLFGQMSEYFTSTLVASLMAIVPSFIITLLIFSILSAAIVGGVVGNSLSVLDRTFGALVGFTKGLAIVSIFHFGVTLIAGQEPEWLKGGETYQLSRFGAEFVRDGAQAVVLSDEVSIDEEAPNNLKDQFSRMFDDAKEYTFDKVDEVNNVQMDDVETKFIDSDAGEFISEEIIDE